MVEVMLDVLFIAEINQVGIFSQLYGVVEKSTFPFLTKEIQVAFGIQKLESKFKMLRQAKHTRVYKRFIYEGLHS